MSYRIWRAVFGALAAKRGQKMDRSIDLANLSAEEREQVAPYVEYVVQVGPPWPLPSLVAGVGLGGFAAFTGLAILVTKSVLLGIPPTIVGVVLAYVSWDSLYPRKKRQKELYETLLDDPRRLLDPEYRSRFDDLVDVEADERGPGEGDPARGRDDAPAGNGPSGRSRSGSEGRTTPD